MHIHLYTCKCVDLCTYMYRYGCMWLHHTHLFRSKAAADAVTSTGAPMPARVQDDSSTLASANVRCACACVCVRLSSRGAFGQCLR